ncbi:MAG: alpha-hydroxy-acid oxidizing protein, partial [Clostridia bacterium]|nr:alpha-hydroxy-acid oxidizing protein [Clostridia bacterium]
ELEEIIGSCSLPVIIKGILSLHDAGRCLEAGAQGLLISHHNNRIEYAMPPLAMIPEIADLTGGRVPIFVDCEIQTGMDAFKALALQRRASIHACRKHQNTPYGTEESVPYVLG